MKLRRAQGFTLVELIVVILLLAIISAYAASRFSGRASVAAQVLQEQVISVVRQVQLNRMQSNVELSSATATNDFTLVVESDCVGSQAACTTRDEARSDWVSSDVVSFSTSVSPIEFDLLGNPIGASIAGTAIRVRSASQNCVVNLNSQGYVFSGGCS
ncbi:prepilin-type N-terminal cleavage/methylation domain-containing protein [Vibrio sp. 16]|uniref:prepilin-type N-terminal cleavage/methylation domain-containing protein n=1 Tax=Vibrio sp. 16 TaxID=391586 RepID=UPI00018F2C36|nr:type II secretion system protein [Vibrio sp. 16]EED26676.1 msha pilin protein mshc [Vibrio sp. 16]CAK4069679.1 hypothetical protein VDT1_1935 [Vibrio sp. 16]